eukprot:gb/GECG01000928.1/.p1 GENE.gb/GECG01000928.1/~~gb/GECG01000928.1/.p1  ORF type:complete len:481 (+),score=87.17 gb/GECG01000928.1/:1-1443(+)
MSNGFVNITEDGGVQKKVLQEGHGDFPNEGDRLTVHYTGKLEDGHEVDSSRSRNKPYEFVLGSNTVIKALDHAFASMRKGERATIVAKPEYAYGETGVANKESMSIPGNATLTYDLELIDFEAPQKDPSEMTPSEILEKAEELKTDGNSKIKENLEGAVNSYNNAIRHLEEVTSGTASPLDDEQSQKVNELKLSCHLNVAMAQIKLQQYREARKNAEEALLIQPDNIKAKFRRGVASMHLGDLSDAKVDILEAAKAKPNDKAIRQEYEELTKKINAAKKKEKKAFGNLFGKVSLYEDRSGVISHTGPLPRTYFDVRVGQSGETKRISFRLFSDTVPRTAENFRSLCAGDNEEGLTFKNCPFHRIIPGFMAQGGDITNQDGTGGKSIYGDQFDDENFQEKHDREGVLSMANRGPNTNSSQFFITFAPQPHLDGKHMVFGEVTEGMDVVRELERIGTNEGKPSQSAVIVGCGELPKEESRSD